MKICSKCKQQKSVSEFHRHTKSKDGLNYYCKDCNRDSVKKYKNGNIEKVKKTNKQYRASHVERRLYHAANLRARNRGLEFNIEESDITIPDYCPYTGIRIDKTVGHGRTDSNPSLDRIDNTKGYIKGNIEVLSDLGNRMKSNASVRQLQNFALEILKRYPLD